jgi:hypothetical protein
MALGLYLPKGVDPTVRLAMRHPGSDYDALRSTIGKGAGMAVADTGKPVFKRWQPYNREKSTPVEPPVRKNEVAATEVAPLAEAA